MSRIQFLTSAKKEKSACHYVLINHSKEAKVHLEIRERLRKTALYFFFFDENRRADLLSVKHIRNTIPLLFLSQEIRSTNGL